MAELRLGPASYDSATEQLRWSGDELDAEFLWTAVLTAVHMAETEKERWLLADGVIDEQIGTRPELAERWRGAYHSDEAVRAVFATMWADLDAMPYGRGWWDIANP